MHIHQVPGRLGRHRVGPADGRIHGQRSIVSDGGGGDGGRGDGGW